MFGSLLKAMLPEQMKVDRKNLKVVSIMPCTAKKFEAQRPEFARGRRSRCGPCADHAGAGADDPVRRPIFNTLQPESFDMPFGFYTGAGVIFGNSGGVTEAVLRYAAEKVTGEQAGEG